MRIPKFQPPVSREIPMTKHQNILRPGHSASGSGHSHRYLRLGASLVLGCWILVLPVQGQFSIGWFKIAGGGGTSTGGVYSISGTIGQHDAGPTLTNGQFSVTGGFWAQPQAVQMPGAPLLVMAPATPGYATISWTPASPGYILQETWSLAPANWTNALSGATNPVVISTTLPAKFYRLYKP